ncbi:MAG TPA: YjbH domain-containing protein [Rhizomicrobium sp.]|nr:YjbH domain-containing protein [Rhizomicrobium sp.]
MSQVRACRAKCVRLATVAGALLLIHVPGALAQEKDAFTLSRTTYGEIGLLDMPSARMAPDGQFALTVGALQGTQRYNFGFQILPWLEASFRFSHILNFRGSHNYYDRSFGMKVRLSREDEYFPEISLGARDLIGTGIYGAEYLVASKRLEDFDVTAGIGWGRLADNSVFHNPFALLFPSFENRGNGLTGGGQLNSNQLFRGLKVGVFGGVTWKSPIDGLNLIVEYSSDHYTGEEAGGSFKTRIPVNVGASYRLYDVATVSAGWFYGTSYGVTLSLAADPTVAVSPQRFGPNIPPPLIRTSRQQVDALTTLIDRNKPRPGGVATLPWVQLPPASPDALAVTAALMSENAGVHDVDMQGRTLLVDARLTQLASTQCDRYAHIAAAIAAQVDTVALYDQSDMSGQVAVCTVSHRSAALASETDGTGDAAPPDGASPPVLYGAELERKIRDDVTAQQVTVEALSVNPGMLWLYFNNSHYSSESEAAGRIARVLMTDTPSDVEIFHLVSVKNGMPERDFQIVRSALERAVSTYGTANQLGDVVSLAPPPLANPVLDRGWGDSYPRLHWDIGPGLREGLFDPNRPFQIQLYAALDASIEVTPQLSFEGRGEANIYNDFDFSLPPNSVLPHVRTDLLQYESQGAYGIALLQANYRTRITRDVYFEAKAGYLESMFAGGGVQALWRPEGQRFSLGIDIYDVWKRDFDRLFGVQGYHVLTGHITAYYQSPWYGLNFAVHAGRYLAGDYGATFEVTRRFDTGVEIGAFATFTNVPFAKFGEGSFDKGIVIHIPFEWALPFYSQSSYDLDLRSLTRDGGQRLEQDDSLFEDTRATSYGEVLGHIDEITAP